MKSVRHTKLAVFGIAAALLLTPSLAFSKPHQKKPSAKVNVKPYDGKHHKNLHKGPKHKQHPRGQAAIDSARAEQIQQALVREHYLNGEPSSNWDASTQEAMRRYQADQGWQTKTVPDSRALIRLGLGPNHDHLLNPESAMVSGPVAAHATHTSSGGSGSSAAALPTQSSVSSGAPVNVAPDLSSSR